MRARETVIVLVATADWCFQPLGQRHAVRNRIADDDPTTREDHRKLRPREQPRRLADSLAPARRQFKPRDGRQADIDHLGPEVPRHVDLRRRRQAKRLQDHPVQHLGNARGIADFFLVAHHVAEERHLLDFLEAALADGPVGRLRRDQQHRRVVPVGRLDRRHEIRDARPVLRNRHRDLARRPRIAIADRPGIALMRAVPERDPRLGEEVRNRHHGRPDDPEGVLDAVHLQHLHEGFLGRHFHGAGSLGKIG